MSIDLKIGRTGIPDVQGVVLAGAYSWNNSVFDKLVTRPLLPVADSPLAFYALDWLKQAGVQKAAVCTNRQTSNLRETLLEHGVLDGIELTFFEDPMPRGSAGCVRDAAAESTASTFVVASGTAIPNVDLGDLIERHRSAGAALTIVAHYEGGVPAGRQIPSGIYVVERRALDLVKPVGYVDIKENLIPVLYDTGERVVTYSVAEPSPRILDLQTYLTANEWMVKRLAEAQGGTDIGTRIIDRGAFIAADAVLIGPILLGQGARVMAGATIVGPTSIGAGSDVRSGALVSRCAVWRNCVVGEGAMADRSLIAGGATLAPSSQTVGGVKVADRRLRMARATNDGMTIADQLRRRFSTKPVLETGTTSGSGGGFSREHLSRPD